jgi:hypothetical protein
MRQINRLGWYKPWLVTALLMCPGIARAGLDSSPNGQFTSPDGSFTLVVGASLDVVNNLSPHKARMSLGTIAGNDGVRASWAPQSNMVISAVGQGSGFQLIGARVAGRAVKKVNIPDPGDDLYDKMEQSLKIKVGNGGYRVSGERLLDVNWDASSAKVVEEWSLVNPLEADEKPIQFKFEVDYLFEDSGAKISEIRALGSQ